MSKYNQEIEMKNNNKSNKLDLNAVEMVFGTANSPKSINPDVHIITNEKRNGKEPGSNHKNDTTDFGVDTVATQPLLERDRGRQKPPLAGPEIDDLDDETPLNPNSNDHGIDDGLLEPGDKHPEAHDNSGHEDDGEPRLDKDGNPIFTDDGVGTDDGKWWPQGVDEADFPYDGINGIGPRFGDDHRPISPMPDGSLPDVNTYQQKKNLAQGMMDLALLSANANQLRYVLESSTTHPYFYPSLVFIALSIILQIAVGVGLILNSRYDVKDDKEIHKADKINNMTVLGVFLVTIVNVFITSFSVATPTTAVLPPAATQNIG